MENQMRSCSVVYSSSKAGATPVVSSVGFTGNKSLETDFHVASVPKELSISVQALNPGIQVTLNTCYGLIFGTWFDNLNAGFIGVITTNLTEPLMQEFWCYTLFESASLVMECYRKR
jgi:hypothetical protein